MDRIGDVPYAELQPENPVKVIISELVSEQGICNIKGGCGDLGTAPQFSRINETGQGIGNDQLIIKTLQRDRRDFASLSR